MKKNRFTLTEIIIAFCICALLAVFLLPRIAKAQPYYTNAPQVNGPWQYNQGYPAPLQPSKTLANQYSAGTLAGSIPGCTVPYQGFYTNTFGTNIFSTAPIIVLSTSLTNSIAAVISSSPTNFVISQMVTNATVYWEATGH